MVEGQPHPGDVWKVGRDVAAGELDEAVLHILWMDERDLVEDFELFQQSSAHETVEVAAGDKTTLLNGGGCHRRSTPLAWTFTADLGNSASSLNRESSGAQNTYGRSRLL